MDFLVFFHFILINIKLNTFSHKYGIQFFLFCVFSERVNDGVRYEIKHFFGFGFDNITLYGIFRHFLFSFGFFRWFVSCSSETTTYNICIIFFSQIIYWIMENAWQLCLFTCCFAINLQTKSFYDWTFIGLGGFCVERQLFVGFY